MLQCDPSLRFVKQSSHLVLESGVEQQLSELLRDPLDDLTPEDIIERNQLYLTECNERKIYVDKALHVSFLQLIFSLLITPLYVALFQNAVAHFLCRGTLQPLYTDQFPVNNKKLNIPYLLHARKKFPRLLRSNANLHARYKSSSQRPADS